MLTTFALVELLNNSIHVTRHRLRQRLQWSLDFSHQMSLFPSQEVIATMSTQQLSRVVARRSLLSLPSWSPRVCEGGWLAAASRRTIHYAPSSLPAITPSKSRRRPSLQPNHHTTRVDPTNRRTIFIQTESTPNPDVSSVQRDRESVCRIQI